MTENTTTFPKDDFFIEDEFDADLQEEIGADNLRAIKSRIALKPCPFCGGQPGLLPSPDLEHHGYFVRCCCDSAHILHPTVDEAVSSWNMRYCEQPPATGLLSLVPSYLRNAPFAMYVFGSLVSSIGMGLREGFPWFLSALGVCSVAGALTILCFADLAADKSKKAKAGHKWRG